ncbi:hypothetical protein F2Q69_00053957 [Brassica cretica]|uniref:Uncharacterized protein n=1 Tax=Brassica cretica TaxID=69181 RepID=A0A8S9N1P4_BRACR|nr:hypothetical protein F2Q69_00053957 [Brassica cretica]
MVSVPPTENPVPALASATVLDLPSVSLGNSDCEVSLPPSLPTELSDQPALASDAEPPTSETLATVSSVVPVAEEGTIVLAAPASAEKITNQVYKEVQKQTVVPSHSVLAQDSAVNTAAVVQGAGTNEGPSPVLKEGATVKTVHDLSKGQLYVDLSGSPGFSLIASSSSGESSSEMASKKMTGLRVCDQ